MYVVVCFIGFIYYRVQQHPALGLSAGAMVTGLLVSVCDGGGKERTRDSNNYIAHIYIFIYNLL